MRASNDTPAGALSGAVGLLGVSEVAAAAGLSRARVSELARMGRMPAPLVRIAAGPVWDRWTIDGWVASRLP